MSRQAVAKTDIVCNNTKNLTDACEAACKQLEGQQIEKVRYYNGDILFGIKVGHIEIGVKLDANNKITFVGEDVHLNSEVGRAIREQVVMQYKAIAFKKTIKVMGFASIKTSNGPGRIRIEGIKSV